MYLFAQILLENLETYNSSLLCHILFVSVNWGNARFIWGPSLDYDNRILLRYTTCDFGSYPVVQG